MRGMEKEIKSNFSADMPAPHQSLRDSFPPKGEAL